jgi:hypothetical protein
MELKYLEIMVYFSEIFSSPMTAGQETSKFYDTIRSAIGRFAAGFAATFPDEYPALKETLLTKFRELHPTQATVYTPEKLNKRSNLEQVVIMIYEGLIVQNLTKSVIRFCQQYNTLPSIGQVFTLYDYETEFQALLENFSRVSSYSVDSMSCVLSEYNFILILLNYADSIIPASVLFWLFRIHN